MQVHTVDDGWALLVSESEADSLAIAQATDAGHGDEDGRIAVRHADTGGLYRVEDAEPPHCLRDTLSDCGTESVEDVLDDLRAGKLRAHGAIHGVPGASPVGALIL